MGYSDKEILKDKQGLPIPQIWDDILDEFVPYGKVQEVRTIGNTVEYTFVEQLEIRDNEPRFFTVPEEVMQRCSDFDIYISDTHRFQNNTMDEADFVLMPLRVIVGSDERGEVSYTVNEQGQMALWSLRKSLSSRNRCFHTIRYGGQINMSAGIAPINHPVFDNLLPYSQLRANGSGYTNVDYSGELELTGTEVALTSKKFFRHGRTIGICFKDALDAEGNLLLDEEIPPAAGAISITFKGTLL